MTREQFELLKRGDIVRGKLSEQAYVVNACYGDRVTAVTTVDITNPPEWELVVSGGMSRGSSAPAPRRQGKLRAWLSRRPYSLENLAISIVWSIIGIGGGVLFSTGNAREAFLAAFCAGGALAITWLFLDRRE